MPDVPSIGHVHYRVVEGEGDALAPAVRQTEPQTRAGDVPPVKPGWAGVTISFDRMALRVLFVALVPVSLLCFVSPWRVVDFWMHNDVDWQGWPMAGSGAPVSACA
ncbi:hypothetical protein GCM10023209_18960 [Roseibacterium beibuensis]|uniref:Uncharacterized protein n=1 Tax=[Roseibacterium] beibuensis TaxID=1193142 RepID=A0ABP9LAN5_9RHOB